MHLRKGNEWKKKGMKWNYVTLFGCFKIKEWKRMKMNGI